MWQHVVLTHPGTLAMHLCNALPGMWQCGQTWKHAPEHGDMPGGCDALPQNMAMQPGTQQHALNVLNSDMPLEGTCPGTWQCTQTW